MIVPIRSGVSIMSPGRDFVSSVCNVGTSAAFVVLDDYVRERSIPGEDSVALTSRVARRTYMRIPYRKWNPNRKL